MLDHLILVDVQGARRQGLWKENLNWRIQKLIVVVGGDLNVLLKALLAKNEGKSGARSRVISRVCRSQY